MTWWCIHRGLLQFFLSLDYSKKTTRVESQMSNFIQHFFKIVLYWCLDLICHNIGTHLKHNKYIFDISIPFCHPLYLSATLKQCFTEFAVYGNVDLPSCLHVSTRPNSYVRFDWSVIFRVRFENQNILYRFDCILNTYNILYELFIILL